MFPSACRTVSQPETSGQLQLTLLSDGSDSADDAPEDTCEDNEGEQLDYHIGSVLKDRYEMVSMLGDGAFGRVMKCLDRHKNEFVAVKVVMNFENSYEVARSEIAVLEEINSLDDDNKFACVRMLDWFECKRHICIVFELLGLSTFEFLRQNDFLPFSVEQIRHMAFQLFRAVSFLHRNKLTHTDLKPENILFVSSAFDLEDDPKTMCVCRKPKSLEVKVVDFGTATFDHQHHESLVSTRHYRAPEVILDLGWNQSCDVWSLGCVLFEFYFGQTLFLSHDCLEHLAMMEEVLGPIPPHLLEQTRKKHFVHNNRLKRDEQSSSGGHIREHCRPLKFIETESEEEQQLLDLLGCMLEYDVGRRITLEEALWHPFFSLMRTKQTQRS
ncbi:dual specificity protein kinase CLK2 isoform X2 [Oryzias melastigma]|uniref:dual specificity protein kinase CLK2 isoform X2 n=1 Tax=Oryzias melastigma TaxID=30732 RepID=UPI000CF818B1|nr:dual specificity protein kinase CLK2 isoform X2 [Oryzias melastigma]